jgi:Ni,Fe-hydrogenase I cytochrome b subunit
MHAVVVILPPALVITGYFFFIPNYMLNAGDTAQQSIHTLLEGFMRVLIGGSFTEFQKKIIQNSYEFFLIVIPLAAGFVISLLSIFHRRGIFAKIDLRLALLIPSILPAYIVVRPAAYFPRFSFPILALDLLLIGMFLYHLQTHNHDIKNASP